MAKISLLLTVAALSVCTAYWAPDLPKGPFCGLRNECCSNRADRCSHEILGTLCYCDEFCGRTTASDDCCPDYAPVCLNQTIPGQLIKPCEYKGKVYLPGDTRLDNCNLCTCTESGETANWNCGQETCLMNEDLARNVDGMRRGWRAATYPQFWGRTLKDGIKLRLGTMPLRPETRHMGSVTYEPGALPDAFDARAHWPRLVSSVQDQGWCGADWAVSTATVLADRFAIQSKGMLKDELSAQTLLSCNTRGQQGCGGGHIDTAWQFATKYGLVSESCLPFEGRTKACPFPLSGNATKVPCGSNNVWSRVYRSGPPSKLSTEKDIMYDIINWGPVQAIITVYQDLFHYREGVYRHIPLGDTKQHGLHSVRVAGWGVERGQPYWLIANSWGREWGENGYIRVARDDPVTSLEFVVTTLADVTEYNNKRKR